MSKLELRKETRLETAPMQEISATLDFKLAETSPEGVADYIGLSLQNIGDRLDRIKDAETQIKLLKKELVAQQDIIKIGSAKWLSDSGIDKLQGIYVSSVSVSPSNYKNELKIHNEESIINQGYFKTVVDKTAVKNAILDGAKVDGAEIEVIYEENKIRVNSRKKVIDENKRD